jgi:hypothetical protein
MPALTDFIYLQVQRLMDASIIEYFNFCEFHHAIVRPEYSIIPNQQKLNNSIRKN